MVTKNLVATHNIKHKSGVVTEAAVKLLLKGS